MNDKNLINYFLDTEITSKNQAYQAIAEFVSIPSELTSKEQEQIVDLLLNREKIGDTLIAEGVVLPHLETNIISSSHIYLIRCKEAIVNWSQEVKNIKLIIAILLKEDEKIETKKKISNFIRLLADDEFIELLLNESQEVIEHELN